MFSLEKMFTPYPAIISLMTWAVESKTQKQMDHTVDERNLDEFFGHFSLTSAVFIGVRLIFPTELFWLLSSNEILSFLVHLQFPTIRILKYRAISQVYIRWIVNSFSKQRLHFSKTYIMYWVVRGGFTDPKPPTTWGLSWSQLTFLDESFTQRNQAASSGWSGYLVT